MFVVIIGVTPYDIVTVRRLARLSICNPSRQYGYFAGTKTFVADELGLLMTIYYSLFNIHWESRSSSAFKRHPRWIWLSFCSLHKQQLLLLFNWPTEMGLCCLWIWRRVEKKRFNKLKTPLKDFKRLFDLCVKTRTQCATCWWFSITRNLLLFYYF